MMSAEGDKGAGSRVGRKSRAGAGARLKGILEQEAKDLRTLEAEAESEEAEAAQQPSAAKKPRQRQHSQQQANGVGRSRRAAAAAAAAHTEEEESGSEDAATEQAAAAARKSKARQAVAALPDDHQAAALAPVPAPAPVAVPPPPAAAARPSIRAPLPCLQRPARGPDEGACAALGQQALSAADACWSVSREAGVSSKHQAQHQQQRGAKRKRSVKASTPPPDAAADEGGEDGVHGSSGLAQQPPGKPLPAGSRPGWLVQALQGGSAALNKRHARGLPDDLSQPQLVEFMLGCADCDYQQHGCSTCRQHPEASRPMARWQPDSGHPQVDLPEAATFTPSREEFADPFAWLASTAEQFVKQGSAKVVPPPGCWAPPAYVQQIKAACSSSSGSSADGLVLTTQRQFVSHLCMRTPPAAAASSNGAAAAAGGFSSSPNQAPAVEQLLGPDADQLRTLDRLAAAGPCAAAAAAGEGQPSGPQQGGDVTMQDADGSIGEQRAHAAVAVKQELPEQHATQHQQQELGSMWRTHTLRSFAAYADWAKRMHFSAQPCNAEMQAMLQQAAAGTVGTAAQLQRRGSTTGLPPAKRPKPDPEHQPQPSRDTGTEAEGTEDADADGEGESDKEAEQQQQRQQPGRHSSRLQAKGRAPLHPLKAPVGGGSARGASPEPGPLSKAKASSKATNSATSATPPTTPRTKAVKSGSRLAGHVAAGMLGLAAGHAESRVTVDQFEAEYWRIVEQQQPGRIVEALAVLELRSSGGGSLVQELQEEQQQQQQQPWGGADDPQQQQQLVPLQQQQQEEAGPWDLSSLPARRENLLRYLPLQQAIPGLTAPVLGVSSCLSSSCWQVTPQGMYGISCLHSGAPRVWYSVPESAHEAFLVAVQDCLPHLFAGNPGLMQQAATAVSPNELRARGVPVCRMVQEPGTFVVLLPNSYHCWLSTGLGIHESVALAPWDCLGAGCDAERSCRQQHAQTAVSQTELLVTLVSSCRCVADAQGPGGGDIEAEADEQAAAVASAAIAALSKAKVRPSAKAAKQQTPQRAHSRLQDTDADEPDQRATARNKHQHAASKQRQRQKSPSASPDSQEDVDPDSSASYTDAGSHSDSDTAQSLEVSFASSSEDRSGGGSDDASSGSSSGGGSDSEAEMSQPCWGAAAGAQQLLEPGLAWGGGACASAALELVPKPAILAAVGELVLRVEEEQCRQAAARRAGIQQEQRMHGAVLPVNHCDVCSADLWLSAVVSSTAAGHAVCPQHAAALSAAADTCTLLFRHSVEELQRLLFEAAALFPGCADDIRAAQQRLRTRPVMRGLKSLGPVLQLQQELPVPRVPELKPGGRDPTTPVADWVKQLMALAAERLPLVGHGAAARLPHRRRRAAVQEALQVAAAAFASVQDSGSVDGVGMGQQLVVRPLRHTDEAVRLVVQQLLKQAPGKQVTARAKAAAAAAAVGKDGKQGQHKQKQQRRRGSHSSSDSEEASATASDADGVDDEEREESPLQPRQRKLPAWLQAECVVDKAVAKRAKATAAAGSKGAAAAAGDAKAAAAAIAASVSLAEVVPLAEQALDAVATAKAVAQLEKRRTRRQREQQRQQQQQDQLQEQRRQREQQDQKPANGVAAAPAVPLTAQQLSVLQQQQLLVLQQQSQQLLLAATPGGLHRPPQARPSKEQLARDAASGGKGAKGRGKGDKRTSSSGGGRQGQGMPGATEQQQQLAAQLTLQQLQLQAQFRAAALAAAAAAAGQGAPAAATVPAAGAAAAAPAGAQAAQAGAAAAAGVPGFVGFPGPLITMHNGVPVLIFAAPLPQQQQQSNSAAATASADPAAQAATAAAAAPADAGDEVQQQQAAQAATAAVSTGPEVRRTSNGAALPAAGAPQGAAAVSAAPAAAPAAAAAVDASHGQAADLLAHSSGQLASSASMQHSSGQLTDAEAAAAAAHAEAEAVANKAAAEAVAAAAAEARLAAGIVGNGHPTAPQGGSSMGLPSTTSSALAAPAPASTAAAAGTAPVPLMQQQQQMSLPQALPAVTTAAAVLAVSMPLQQPQQQPPAYQAWPRQQQQQVVGVVHDAAHPTDCMLRVEEFFHSQEPGHAEQPAAPAVAAAAAAAAEAPAPQPPAAVAVAEPTAQQAPAAVSDAQQAAPAATAAAGPTTAGGVSGAVDVKQDEARAEPAAAAAATPASASLVAAAAAAQGVVEVAPLPAAAAAKGDAATLAAGTAGAKGEQQAAPAAVEPTAAAAPAGGGAAGGGVGRDDQMDELELEPLVDFGMDDFDW